jgi:alpha-glucosidase
VKRIAMVTLMICVISLLLVGCASTVKQSTDNGSQSVPVQEIHSPDGMLTVEFDMSDGVPRYCITRQDQMVIDWSKLGVTLRNWTPLDSQLTLLRTTAWVVDTSWTTVWGERETVLDRYNAMKLDLGHRDSSEPLLSFEFRAYDDGIAFRYMIHGTEGDSVELMSEATQFTFAENASAWWIPAFAWNRYEYLYRNSSLADLDSVHTPLTLETESGLFIALHEAALTDFSSMALRGDGSRTLEAVLFPWSDGVKVRGPLPMTSSWRTIQVAETPGGLIESDLVLNCNDPCKIEDTSWIKPGKYVGVWWGMHLGIKSWGSGEIHGATTENTKRYIDFAAKYGLDGVLVEGWNVGWDGDWVANADSFSFTQPYPDYDLNGLAEYAESRGVSLIAHNETSTGIANYERQLEDAFSLYESLGITMLKSGYVGQAQEIERRDPETGEVLGLEWHHGQWMVQHYRHVVKTAAKHRIMLDVHEPIKPTGIRRTWPNMMTREGARGQEYDAWSGDGGNPPEHATILPFTRMLAGPFDMTPGTFDLLLSKADRPDNRVNTTLAKQLALYVVIYSPLHMASDLPENYEARLDAFHFIRDVPTDWAETCVLNGVIGDFVTIARKDRNSEDWYLGAVTDEQSRTLEVPLSFLSEGRYKAQLYLDGPDADWRSTPYSMIIRERAVTTGDTFTLQLGPGGGAAIRFVPTGE